MKNSVTVIIPTYNRANLIGRAINSVLAATAPGDEVLVIDDGSTDDTEAVVRSFGDAIRYVRIENSGVGAARNLGIRLSTCPLVTFLDSDDEWLPDKLELQRNVMTKFPEVVFCFSNMQCKLPTGEVLHDILSEWRRSSRVGSVDAPAQLGARLGPGMPFSSIDRLPSNRADFHVHVGDMYSPLMDVLYVSCITVMVRKDRAGVFRFREDRRIMEAWDCFARLAKAGPAAYLDCELGVQNAHTGPRLTDADDINQLTARISLLQQVWGTDESFLSVHALHYHDLLRRQYLNRAKALIAKGMLKEANNDLTLLGGGPWPMRLLTLLPSPLVKGLVGVRRGVQGWRSAILPEGSSS
jgi:glycosyltransferase involved in cell wall biosynthesis